MSRRPASAVMLLVALSACSGPISPTAPTQTPSTPAPPAGPGTQSSFSIRMPVEQADSAALAYGIWPFGVHGGGHAFDGHPGWDVEFRAGAQVLAAADGTVQSVFDDSHAPGRFTVQLEHAAGNGRYRTVYTNLASIAPEIRAGAAVLAGQRIGIPGSQTLTIGRTTVTYSMVHFQVDDFSKNSGQTNVHAVTPAAHLSSSARAVFESIWATVKYYGELTEPFTENPRDVTFPLTRVWTRESGTFAARVGFRRLDATTNDYEYSLMDAEGRVSESGAVRVDPTATPVATIDLGPGDGGTVRLGVYDIVGGTMRMLFGAPGQPRPGSLVGATVYRTE